MGIPSTQLMYMITPRVMCAGGADSGPVGLAGVAGRSGGCSPSLSTHQTGWWWSPPLSSQGPGTPFFFGAEQSGVVTDHQVPPNIIP